jgi:hypothetical protein
MQRRDFLSGAAALALPVAAGAQVVPGTELLIQAKSQVLTGDPITDSKRWRAGEVIVAREIGHPGWGRQELINPLFRIVRLPAIPFTIAHMWEAPERARGSSPARTLQHRMYSFAFDREDLPPEFARWWQNDRRSSDLFDLHHVAAVIRHPWHVHYTAVMRAKPPISDRDLV